VAGPRPLGHRRVCSRGVRRRCRRACPAGVARPPGDASSDLRNRLGEEHHVTAASRIDPEQFLHEHLARASPDSMRELLGTFIAALLGVAVVAGQPDDVVLTRKLPGAAGGVKLDHHCSPIRMADLVDHLCAPLADRFSTSPSTVSSSSRWNASRCRRRPANCWWRWASMSAASGSNDSGSVGVMAAARHSLPLRSSPNRRTCTLAS